MMNKKITIRPKEHKDYKSIVSLILRSFQEGTDYSDGTDIIALVEEIRVQHFSNKWMANGRTKVHDVSGNI